MQSGMSLELIGWLQPGNEIPYGAGFSDLTCRLSHCPRPPTIASTALRSRSIGRMHVNASVRESRPSAPAATCHGRHEVSIAPSSPLGPQYALSALPSTTSLRRPGKLSTASPESTQDPLPPAAGGEAPPDCA